MDFIDRQIAIYKNKNTEFEACYKQDFDSFTASLKNCATHKRKMNGWNGSQQFFFFGNGRLFVLQVIE